MNVTCPSLQHSASCPTTTGGTLADDYSNVPGERIELQARSFTACRQIEREVDPQQGVGLGGSSSSGRCQIDTVKRPHSYVSVTLNSEEGTTV